MAIQKKVLRKNVTRNRTINDGEDQERPIATVVLPHVRNTSECIKKLEAIENITNSSKG